MQLLTKELKKKLIRNGETHRDHFPVVKFFDPCGTATWLISEMDGRRRSGS